MYNRDPETASDSLASPSNSCMPCNKALLKFLYNRAEPERITLSVALQAVFFNFQRAVLNDHGIIRRLAEFPGRKQQRKPHNPRFVQRRCKAKPREV